MSDQFQITHQIQPTPYSCNQACLAMLLNHRQSDTAAEHQPTLTMPTPTPKNENATVSRTDKAVVCDASGSAFRWAYAAVCALAVKLLEEDNRTCGDNWPAGQSWTDLGGSSRSIYLHRARELSGIPHDDFLAVVRADSEAVEDIYEARRLSQNKPDEERPAGRNS